MTTSNELEATRTLSSSQDTISEGQEARREEFLQAWLKMHEWLKGRLKELEANCPRREVGALLHTQYRDGVSWYQQGVYDILNYLYEDVVGKPEQRAPNPILNTQKERDRQDRHVEEILQRYEREGWPDRYGRKKK